MSHHVQQFGLLTFYLPYQYKQSRPECHAAERHPQEHCWNVFEPRPEQHIGAPRPEVGHFGDVDMPVLRLPAEAARLQGWVSQ